MSTTLQKHNPPSVEVLLKLELKQLSTHLQYSYLEAGQKLHVIIPTYLAEEQKNQLLDILKIHKRDITWQISNIKGISPTVFMHRIVIEDNSKNNIESQRRLNSIMKKVVKKEIIKW